MQTLIDLVLARSADRPAFRFAGEDGQPGPAISFALLQRRARAEAARLQVLGLGNRRVVLLCETGPHFLFGYFGAILAGAVPVPLPVPRGRRAADRLTAAIAGCEPSAILTTTAVTGLPRFAAAARGVAQILQLDEPCTGDPEDWIEPRIDPEAPAMLQYSSGSTGDPRGTILSHRAILTNQESIRLTFGHDEATVFAGWLPLFHDMGLIGNVLQPFYLGVPCTLMPPLTFLARPMAWLDMIAASGATTSGGPDSAFALCTRAATTDDVARLRLDRWAVAFNGSEPASARTMADFSARFAPAGFSPASWLPCYGLAEATLLVSGAHRHADTADETVSCGPPAPGCTIEIVDEHTRAPCPEGRAGEIMVHGAGIASGYWGDAAATLATFGRDETKGSGTLRTGDLGLLRNGKLIVIGRLKDLVIRGGEKWSPEPIEAAALAADPAARAAAAFNDPIDGGLVIAVEIARQMPSSDRAAVAARIARAVTSDQEIRPDRIALIAAATLPRTTSGKIRRGETRRLWQEGALALLLAADVDIATTENAGEATGDPILFLVAAQTNLSPDAIDETLPLPGLGLDSLSLMRLREKIFRHTGRRLPIDQFFLSGCAGLRETLARTSLEELSSAPEPSDLASPAERRFWISAQLDEGGRAQSLVRAFRLPPGHDRIALAEALRLIRARHPALRRCFTLANHDLQPSECAVDVPWLTIKDGATDAIADLDRDIQLPFDLATGPLFRAVLRAEPDGSAILLLAAHHAVCDLVSLSILLAELGRVYEALRGGLRIDLPPTMPWHDAEEPSEAAPIPAAERVPFDAGGFPPSAAADAGVHRLDIDLDAARAASLRDLARRRGATLASVVTAAIADWLGMLGGSDQPAFTLAASVRPSANAQGVGNGVRLVPVQVPLGGADGAEARIAETARALAQALGDRGEAGIGRGRADGYLDVLLIIQPNDSADCAWEAVVLGRDTNMPLPALAATPMAIGAADQPADLMLTVAPWNGGLSIGLSVRGARYSMAMARRMARLLEERIAALIEGEPAPRPRATPIITGPIDPIAAIRARAQVMPAAIAIEAGDTRQTYRELVGRADRIAAALRGRGLGAEDIVAVDIAPGADLPALLTGILAAGAAFLPLDRTAPPGLRTALAVRADASLVIADAPTGGAVTLEELLATSSESSARLPAVSPVQLAYVIATSGSTGRPKLVEVARDQLGYALTALGGALGVTATDRVAALTALSFDIALDELLLPLTRGACIVILDDAARRDAVALRDSLARARPTILQATPTMLRLLIDAGWAGDQELTIWSGGEPLEPALARALMMRSDRLWNLYGPTETTIFSAAVPIRPSDASRRAIPIGPPLAGTDFTISDDAEVAIGGGGVTRGYRDDPARTAAVFRPAAGGRRHYWTGDRIRHSEDGAPCFDGRRDRQVKLNGVRIELDAIEIALRLLPGVTDSAVIVTETRARAMLAGFVAGVAPDELPMLRVRLRELLPPASIPQRLTALAALPRTPGGKRDRAALASIPIASDDPTRAMIDPAIDAIWRDVLGSGTIDPDGNFFDLGGSSLAAMEVQIRIRRLLGREVPVTALFRYPTLRSFSAHLAEPVSARRRATSTTGDGRSRLAARRLALQARS